MIIIICLFMFVNEYSNLQYSIDFFVKLLYINRMENKVVLITGAAKGIGACMAELFAQNGYKITVYVALETQKQCGLCKN